MATAGTIAEQKLQSYREIPWSWQYELAITNVLILDPLISIWVFPKIGVPPNHPILIGFSIINHPFWGTPIFGNTQFFLALQMAIDSSYDELDS